MKNWKQYRIMVWMTLLPLVMLPASCERMDDIIVEGFNCADCYQAKPTWVRLSVFVTINSENPYVPLTVYIGDFEDNVIDWIDTSYNNSFYLDVKPDRYYSVKAEYKDGSKTVFAIDGDKVKLKENTTDCDAACYYQTGGYIDLRLK